MTETEKLLMEREELVKAFISAMNDWLDAFNKVVDGLVREVEDRHES